MNLSIAGCIDWLITNNQSVFGKVLNFAPIRFIGVLSYSIYLWQQPFLRYSADLWWTYFPFNLILLMCFSLFSYFAIEKTFLQLRKRWEKALFFVKTENAPALEATS